MRFRTLGLLSLGLMASLSSTARAAFVVNGGFEMPTATPPYQTFNVGSTAITGWTVISGTTNQGGGSVDLLNGFATAHSGAQAVDLDGTINPAGSQSSAGGLSQVITGLTAGTAYVLDFFYANNPNASVAGAQATIDGLSLNFSHSGSTFTSLNYTEANATFVASATSLTLAFRSTDPAGDQSGILLDDVSINTAAVPEPASLAMLGLGLLAVGGVARSRRRVA